MTKAEMRTLRFQLQLTGLLFAVSVAIAVSIVCCRGLFERWLFEKHAASYDSLPKRLQETFDHLRRGEPAADALRKLTASDQEMIYQCCLAEEADARAKMARALCQAHADFYVTRAERTIVVGNGDQKLRAVEFLEASQCPRACQTTGELSQWARRRQRPELSQRLEAAEKSLKPFAKVEKSGQDSTSRGERGEERAKTKVTAFAPRKPTMVPTPLPSCVTCVPGFVARPLLLHPYRVTKGTRHE